MVRGFLLSWQGMATLFAVIFFALGVIVASFVGVVVARLGTGHSFVRGRSRCDACDTPLAAGSLVPIVSYMVLGGRACCCGACLSFSSPLTEVLLGALFVLTYLEIGLTLALPLFLAGLALLLALVLYDLRHQILPSALLYPFIGLALCVRLLVSADSAAFWTAVGMAGVLAFILFAIHVLSRGRAMGFADTPLVFGLALLTGAELAFAGFAFSFWIGAAVGITLLAGKARGHRMGVEVPFAPFLAAGFLLAHFTQWNPFALLML